MTLYLIRHGKTLWNEKGLLQGKSDIPLNEEGKVKALELKDYFIDKNIDLCFSSPLDRAYTTAKIIFPNLNIIKNKKIVERDLGQFEGKSHTEYHFHDFWDYKANSNYGGVEPVQSLFERSKQFLEELTNNYPNKNIVVVSHGAFLKALHYTIVGYDENEKFDDFSINNCEVKKYEI